jgi:hypothetical protein
MANTTRKLSSRLQMQTVAQIARTQEISALSCRPARSSAWTRVDLRSAQPGCNDDLRALKPRLARQISPLARARHPPQPMLCKRRRCRQRRPLWHSRECLRWATPLLHTLEHPLELTATRRRQPRHTATPTHGSSPSVHISGDKPFEKLSRSQHCSASARPKPASQLGTSVRHS